MSIFYVLGDKTVGQMFLPDGFSYSAASTVNISPLHGRAVAMKKSDFKWISIKGGGWNYGGPQVYVSRKDDELVFGLYPAKSAERELAVSRAIEKISDDFPKVLYYRKFADYQLPSKYDFLSGIKFSNGNPVNPCLLYTKVKCPYRVADLMYFSDGEKSDVVKFYSDYWHVSVKKFTAKFTSVLAEHVSVLHKNGFINDTLDYGNVTLLAEIIDYEWVTAPGIKLPDGTYGTQISAARCEKEILYGVEICLQLRALLREKYDFFDIYSEFIESYYKNNSQFVENSINIQKMLRREKFIL